MKPKAGSFAIKPEFHVTLAVRNALERQILEDDQRRHAARQEAAQPSLQNETKVTP